MAKFDLSSLNLGVNTFLIVVVLGLVIYLCIEVNNTKNINAGGFSTVIPTTTYRDSAANLLGSSPEDSVDSNKVQSSRLNCFYIMDPSQSKIKNDKLWRLEKCIQRHGKSRPFGVLGEKFYHSEAGQACRRARDLIDSDSNGKCTGKTPRDCKCGEECQRALATCKLGMTNSGQA